MSAQACSKMSPLDQLKSKTVCHLTVPPTMLIISELRHRVAQARMICCLPGMMVSGMSSKTLLMFKRREMTILDAILP